METWDEDFFFASSSFQIPTKSHIMPVFSLGVFLSIFFSFLLSSSGTSLFFSLLTITAREKTFSFVTKFSDYAFLFSIVQVC